MEFNKFYENEENRKNFNTICRKFYNSSVIKEFTEFDDFYQLSLIKLSKYIGKYDSSKSKLTTFMYRIIGSVHNTILQTESYKKRDINIRLQTLSLDYHNNDSDDNFETCLKSNFSIENEISDIDWFIEKYLGVLKNEIDKQILILKYKGYTNKEICDMLNLTKYTVDTHIKTIKNKLLKEIKRG